MSAPDSPKRREKANSDRDADRADAIRDESDRLKEIGGRGGLDPTRYGDWEKAGRCIDF